MSSSTQPQSNNNDASGTPPVEKKQPLNPTNSTSEPDANTAGNTTASGFDDYPEQKHAGAVGYGPNFGNRAVSVPRYYEPVETILNVVNALCRDLQRRFKGSRSRPRER